MNKKAEKFASFLKEHEITAFDPVEELEDEFHTAIFRSRLEVEGQQLPVAVVLDDSIYALFRLQIVDKAVKENNKEALLNHINELNRQYKVFKYYLSDTGGIHLDCCMPSSEESFDGELVRAIIDVVMRHVIEQYPVLMKKVWAD